MKKIDDNLMRSDATHLLSCKHCIGRQTYRYHMPCIPFGKTKSGRMKVLVFGDRYWKHNWEKKSVRYVFPVLVKPRPVVQKGGAQ